MEEYKKKLATILAEYPRRPVWFGGDLRKKPQASHGLVVCSRCRQIYWVCNSKDICREYLGNGQWGLPRCDPCALKD